MTLTLRHSGGLNCNINSGNKLKNGREIEFLRIYRWVRFRNNVVWGMKLWVQTRSYRRLLLGNYIQPVNEIIVRSLSNYRFLPLIQSKTWTITKGSSCWSHVTHKLARWPLSSLFWHLDLKPVIDCQKLLLQYTFNIYNNMFIFSVSCSINVVNDMNMVLLYFSCMSRLNNKNCFYISIWRSLVCSKRHISLPGKSIICKIRS